MVALIVVETSVELPSALLIRATRVPLRGRNLRHAGFAKISSGFCTIPTTEFNRFQDPEWAKNCPVGRDESVRSVRAAF